MKLRIVIVLIVVGVAFFAASRRQENSRGNFTDAVLAQALGLVSQAEGYQQSREYIDELVQRAHPEAIRFARGAAASDDRTRSLVPEDFNWDSYYLWLFFQMERAIFDDVAQAESKKEIDLRHEIRRSLDELRKRSGFKKPGA